MKQHSIRFPAGVAGAIGILAIIALLVTGRLDAAPSLRDGDLIFQQLQGRQSVAILAATGSPLTHMGIIHIRDGEAFVIEAYRRVEETPLAEWIERGRAGHYALYRLEGISSEQIATALDAADARKGVPYDIFFRPDEAAIYCSELPRIAFAAAGISLGTEQPLGDLALDNEPVRSLFHERWQDHPDCAAESSPDACWERIQSQPIITPASIADDARAELIFSNF
ncbi:MAG: YiiX/YebB-like N1pC/P60 family cysteine hydrolase [Dongiaceae bacterium]